MKKSTKELIIYTILGIIASLVLYHFAVQSYTMATTRINGLATAGIFICPFIGLIYWIFSRQLDE